MHSLACQRWIPTSCSAVYVQRGWSIECAEGNAGLRAGDTKDEERRGIAQELCWFPSEPFCISVFIASATRPHRICYVCVQLQSVEHRQLRSGSVGPSQVRESWSGCWCHVSDFQQSV